MEEKDKKNQEYIGISPNRGYTRVHISTWKVILNNFLGGLAWGFGTVLGATLVVALVVIALTRLGGIPLIGDFLSNILETIQSPTN